MDIIIPEENELYQNYIDRILKTRENVRDENNYQELHHIVPRCMNGSDSGDNLIYLYAQEHYYAHKLLAYENPENGKLQYAYWAMSGFISETQKRDYSITDQDLIEARSRLVGIPKSEKTLKLISEHHADVSGSKNPMFGKHHSEESKEKMRLAFLGTTLPEETKQKISAALKGHIFSEEWKDKHRGPHPWCALGNHPKSNKIQCIETGEIFDCAKSAGKWAGLKGQNPGTSIIKQIRHPDKINFAGRHPLTNQPLTWQYYIEQ